jgi:hypothetical protein
LSINLNDPDIKKYFSNTCNYYHDKYGIWPSATDDASQVNMSEFGDKYYPNGFPDSVKEMWENYRIYGNNKIK